eukprot:2304110-Amphidinium_carterae.1
MEGGEADELGDELPSEDLNAAPVDAARPLCAAFLKGSVDDKNLFVARDVLSYAEHRTRHKKPGAPNVKLVVRERK